MSGQLLSSKVVIVEEEPKVRGIPSAPTSVAGAVGITERGPIGEAVLCTSFDDFQTKFGGFTPDSDLALAAMGFFENGGAQLWVVRTTHYSNVADAATVTAVRAAGFLVAGGGPTPGILLGAAPGPFVLHDGDLIRLAVDGAPSPHGTRERAGDPSREPLSALARRSLRALARAPPSHAQRAKRSDFSGKKTKPPRR